MYTYTCVFLYRCVYALVREMKKIKNKQYKKMSVYMCISVPLRVRVHVCACVCKYVFTWVVMKHALVREIKQIKKNKYNTHTHSLSLSLSLTHTHTHSTSCSLWGNSQWRRRRLRSRPRFSLHPR